MSQQTCLPEHTLEWAGDILGSPIRSVHALTGGMESTIHTLTPERGDPVVIRSYVNQGPPGTANALARREGAVLEILQSTAVPAPSLVGLDPDGARCGVPSVLMEFMSGRREVPDGMRTLASELARTMAALHAVPLPAIRGLPDETEQLNTALTQRRPSLHGNAPSTSLWSLIRDQLPPPDIDSPVLLHNDFGPSNTLFVGGRLSAVVDWTESAAGQAACEVCFCRLNLTLVLGPDAGDLLLQAYEAATGEALRNRGWWDLIAAARVEPDLDTWTQSANYFGPADVTTRLVAQRFADFVNAALISS